MSKSFFPSAGKHLFLFALIFFTTGNSLIKKSKLPSEAEIFARLDVEKPSDVTIVGTADGVIHGVDIDGKTEKWSLSTGGSLVQSHFVRLRNYLHAMFIYMTLCYAG